MSLAEKEEWTRLRASSHSEDDSQEDKGWHIDAARTILFLARTCLSRARACTPLPDSVKSLVGKNGPYAGRDKLVREIEVLLAIEIPAEL